MDRVPTSQPSGPAALFVPRLTLAGLIFWWGLLKAMGTGTGKAVSEDSDGPAFTHDLLLTVFGWTRVLMALRVALMPYRRFTLPAMFVINALVTKAVWQSVVDSFRLWMGGDQPGALNALFYPPSILDAA